MPRTGSAAPGRDARRARLPPDDRHERALRAEGFRHVAGVDEAGRGPLAGPVAAAAVILDPANVPQGLDDSKRLGAGEREVLFEAVMERALAVGVGLVPAGEIDRINIRQATFLAMRRAAQGLALKADVLLIDGRDVPPALPCPARALVAADALSVSVAAASIVAKVVRDRLMGRLDALDPRYGFAGHKGYATAAHRAALLAHGPSFCHRLSFRGKRAPEG